MHPGVLGKTRSATIGGNGLVMDTAPSVSTMSYVSWNAPRGVWPVKCKSGLPTLVRPLELRTMGSS